MGGLDANLMFAPRFQPESQFADEAFAVGQRIFLDGFIVRDGLTNLRYISNRTDHRRFGLLFGQDVLAHFVFAQLQPLPPSAFWCRGRPSTKATYSRFMARVFSCSMRCS